MRGSRAKGQGLRAAIVVATVLLASTASAQRFGGGDRTACSFSYDDKGYFVSPFWIDNAPYTGKITFARIKYRGGFACAQEGPGWAHDFPRMESHFLRLLSELTAAKPYFKFEPLITGTLISLDDKELFKYPVAYLSEPAGWQMTDAEVKGLKKYIERGGFVIMDDMGFKGGGPRDDYGNLLYQWQRAFPKAKWVEMPNDHPIFNAFFKVNLDQVTAYYSGGKPQIFGFFEDNDPKKRLYAVINAEQDLGEYIEFSDEGFNPAPTNEAYKLLINYFIYALTH
jgi:hypothetical protein